MKNQTKHIIKFVGAWILSGLSFFSSAQPGAVHFTPDFSMRNGTLGHKYEMVSWDPSLYREFVYWVENSSGGPVEFMNWRAIFPAGYDPAGSVKYPMIVMLHGAGESGREWTGRFVYSPSDPKYDNNGHNLLWGGREHRDAVTSGNFPGIVIFPQVSFNGAWSGEWDGGALSANGRMTTLIIEHMISNWKVDPYRIAVHGLSNGAKGVWDMAAKRPDLFAAVLPMSGVGSDLNAMTDILVTTPLWQFQGGLDTNPSPGNTNNWINTLETKGGDPRYTIYPSLGHGVWNTAYAEPDFFSWILSQNKRNIHVFGGTTTLCAGATIKLGLSDGFLAYQWTLNGVDIAGATSRTYTTSQAGTYAVKFRRKIDGVWDTSNTVVIQAPGGGSAPVLTYTGSTYLPIQIPGSVDNILNLVAPEGYPQYRWYKNGALWSTTTTNIKLVANNTGNSSTFAGSYTVQVQLPAGCFSSSSNAIVVNFNSPQPTTPVFNILSRTPVSPTQINITWENPAGESGFEVWRYRQGNYVAGPPATGYPLEKYHLVGTVGANVTTFSDTGLRPGANYIYRIRAIVPGGASLSTQPSPTFVTTPQDVIAPSAPGNFVATNTENTEISLSWSASTDNDNNVIYSYELYNNTNLIATLRSDSLDADRTDGNPAPATGYTVTGLTPSTSYTFNVRARDYKGNFSGYSTVTASTTGTTPPPAQNGVSYEYWHFTGTLQNLASFNFSQAPLETGVVNNFDLSVRNREDQFVFNYTALLEIDNPGTYRFYTNSDDGSMLYIEGTTVVSNDGLHATQTRSGTYTFPSAGKYAIRVSFYEQGGGQALNVRYNPGTTDNYTAATAVPNNKLFLPGDAPPPPPDPNGVNYKYWEFSGTLQNLASFNFSQTPTETGIVSNFDLSVSKRNDQFVIDYNAFLEIDAPGTYRFYTNSDDGSWLYIEGALVVNNDGLHGTRAASGTYTFPSAGRYAIRVSFFEQAGNQAMIVRYNPGTTDNYSAASTIPNNKLFLSNGSGAARLAATEEQPQEQMIEEDTNEPDLVAWPMPFKNKLNLKFKKAPGIVHIVVLDRMGNPVMSVPVRPNEKNIEMDLPELPAGQYYLVVGDKRLRVNKD
jgi:predicted esterase